MKAIQAREHAIYRSNLGLLMILSGLTTWNMPSAPLVSLANTLSLSPETTGILFSLFLIAGGALATIDPYSTSYVLFIFPFSLLLFLTAVYAIFINHTLLLAFGWAAFLEYAALREARLNPFTSAKTTSPVSFRLN